MKTKILAAGVLLVVSAVALADRPPPGPPPGFDIDKLEVLLELDGYQKAEVQKVLEAQRTAMRAKREELRSSESRPSFEQMEKERTAAQTATRTQLAKILSEEQLNKFDVLTERPARRAHRPGSENK